MSKSFLSHILIYLFIYNFTILSRIQTGDFVLVEPIEEGDKVKAEISHVLLKTHIKQLKKEGKWPKEFDDEEAKEEESRIDDNDLPAEDEEQYSSDESLEENPNHAGNNYYADEESESDDSSEDEEENSEELNGKNA